jgi:hypothetical protein
MNAIFIFITSIMLFGFTFCASSQDLPLKDGKVFYEQVDSATATKEQLYQRAKLWFANAFKDSRSVIQLDDKDDGQIVGKGNFDVPYKYGVNTVAQCNFTLKIDVKEAKYRIQVYNINYQWANAGQNTMSIEQLKTSFNGRYYNKIAPGTNEKILNLIQDFKTNLSAKDSSNF